jgi:hypothetical protein
MAEIATYLCSSNKCRFTVRLSRDFPVFHTQTPKHLRSLTVTPASRGYVTAFRSDTYCLSCKKVFDRDRHPRCSQCGGNLKEDLLKHPCPQCKKAPVLMPHLLVR